MELSSDRCDIQYFNLCMNLILFEKWLDKIYLKHVRISVYIYINFKYDEKLNLYLKINKI